MSRFANAIRCQGGIGRGQSTPQKLGSRHEQFETARNFREQTLERVSIHVDEPRRIHATRINKTITADRGQVAAQSAVDRSRGRVSKGIDHYQYSDVARFVV